jgi:hypothetical protein
MAMNATRNLLTITVAVVAIFITSNVKADFTFDERVNLESVIPVLNAEHDSIDCFSSDGLEIYIESDRPGGQGGWDLWVLRRASIDEDWGPLENLGPALNTPKDDGSASISADGLTLYFGSNRPGGYGNADVWLTTRATRNAPWGPAMNMDSQINGSADDGGPWISADGLELYFVSWRPGGYGRSDIYVAKRATTSSPWGDPVNLGPGVNSAYEELLGFLSPDRLLLVFYEPYTTVTPRPGGYGGADLWKTRRVSLSDPWQTPVNLGPKVNGSGAGVVAKISLDGSQLYFSEYYGGTWENWQVPIIPVVDFNGDGKVDGNDVLIMTEHWGQNDPLCDIGPSAWGDGNVDLEDLKVLAEYIGKEVEDPTLVAHWAMDETEGTTVHDSAGKNDASTMNGPTWQPAGGKISGALALDGINDFAIANSSLNLGGEALSVFAWVQGGAPGQVVIAPRDGADWLFADAATGSLSTAMSGPGQRVTPLSSETPITDGRWHRIGVVCNGANRILYVDGKEVARGALPSPLDISSTQLLIGSGKACAPGSFWSGLIDDVRIYNRIVQP